MYTNSKCTVKIGDKQTAFFFQGHGRRQGCNLSPVLFNLYFYEYACQSDQSWHFASTWLTQKWRVSCTQMTWCCCHQQKKVYSSTTTSCINSVRPGPWQLTRRKPKLWSSRSSPEVRKTHIKLQDEKKTTHTWPQHKLQRKLRLGCERSEGQSKESFLCNEKKY